MDVRQATEPFAKDSDNIKFTELVSQLAGFGRMQLEIAEALGISPGQLSRVRKGERHASRKHIRSLGAQLRDLTRERRRQERTREPNTVGSSLFKIDKAVFRGLSAKSAVEAFRDLLWARATERRIPTTQICITSEVYRPDGGVDAAISDLDGRPIEADELLTRGTRFQIKTGDFAPWREAQIKKELFGKKARDFSNLGSAIQRTLQEGARLVFVCTGVDPAPEEIDKAREYLRSAFKACGYPNARVEVWCQTHLIGLFQQYPSLCLRLLGHDHKGFRDHRSWSTDQDMQPVVHYSAEQHQLIEEVRTGLRSGQAGHVRLIGEPGVGKTRLALEVTRTDDLSAVTLYVKEGRSLLQSSFINELIQSDDHRFVVLVIDECPNKDRAELWNILKSKSERIRVLTIDHGPDKSTDDMRVVNVEPAGVEEIVAILRDHKLGEGDAKRWAKYCEGCPRVAHVLGENLRMDRVDLLQAPATVEVWDRFIVGHDSRNSEDVELRKIVLRYVSLFERFGFEPPVEKEAQFIATLVEKCDPRLTWPRFQSIVHGLRQRRILQGVRTLYVTPRLLQVHLYRDFWDVYGAGFDIAAILTAMPPVLWNWFVQMLRYADESDSAEYAVGKLLGEQGLFPSAQFEDNEQNGRLIEVLAEFSRTATLRSLQRTIGKMDVKQLVKVKTSRQLIVWALGKIAAWEDCFVDAAQLLLRLAEAENATNANNATGTFKDLFSLIPGKAATQADPAIRLTVLRDALDSDVAVRRQLGLAGCESALFTSSTFRIVSSEYQGIHKTIEFWLPNTRGEWEGTHRDVWMLLVGKLDTWEGADRSQLISTLITAAWSTLHIRPLSEMVTDTLKAVAHDPATDVKGLVELIQRQLRHTNTKLSAGVMEELRSILQSLDGLDFASRLRRLVKHTTWDDYYDEKLNNSRLIEEKLDALADEAMHTPELLTTELPWLVCEESSQAYGFASRLGKRDPDRKLLTEIMGHYAAHHEAASVSFLSGYFSEIFSRDVEEWESEVAKLAENPATASRFSDFVIASGISNKIARKVIAQCQCGAQSRERLERWWFANQLEQLSSEVVEQLIVLQLEEYSGRLWSNAVQMCHTYFLKDGTERRLPEELVFRLLTHKAMADGRAAQTASYCWSRLAKAFLQQSPGRKWDFFRGVLRAGAAEWSVLVDLNTNEEHVLTTLLRSDPEAAFDCITEVYCELGDRDDLLQDWLSADTHRAVGNEGPGPIQYIPSTKLFDWVDENIDERGNWLAGVMPKTVDSTVAGRLTRDFIARYGRNKRIAAALYRHFHSRGWWGNDSDHYRSLRDEARTWLPDEKNLTVRGWIEDYIDGLNHYVDRAELEEERRL